MSSSDSDSDSWNGEYPSEQEPVISEKKDAALKARFDRLLTESPNKKDFQMPGLDLNYTSSWYAIENLHRFTNLKSLDVSLTPSFKRVNLNPIFQTKTLEELLLDINGCRLLFDVATLAAENCLANLKRFGIQCRGWYSGQETSDSLTEVLKRTVNLKSLEIEINWKFLISLKISDSGHSNNLGQMLMIFTDENIGLLSGIKDLTRLTLVNAYVTDEVLRETKLPKLKYLRLTDYDGGIQLSRTGVDHLIANCPNLTQIYWDDQIMDRAMYNAMREGFKKLRVMNASRFLNYPIEFE